MGGVVAQGIGIHQVPRTYDLVRSCARHGPQGLEPGLRTGDAPRMRRTALVLRVLLASAPFVAACDSAPVRSASNDARAADLFALHCSACHGQAGDGDGAAVAWLFPPPRDFTQGRFRIVSGRDGGPSRDDLVGVLKRGLPGSAMPSFAWMPEGDLERLAEHVRALAVEGLAARDVIEAERAGESLALADARALAVRRLAPGEPVHAPAEVEVDADLLERGERVFADRCAACHGADGRAEDDVPQWTDEGDFGWARDFTAGVLKGGATREALTRRILCGMPGTTMPAQSFADERDLQALLAHLAQLIPGDADARLVQRRVRFAPGREDDWSDARPAHVVLAPMQWSPERVLALEVRAKRVGDRLALRLEWDDPQRDVGAASVDAPVDAVAVAFSAEAEPPLMGMGARGHALDLWHWRANLWIDRAGVLDLVENPPHGRPSPRVDAPVLDAAPRYLPALPTDAPTDELRTLFAEGGAPVALDGDGLLARPVWADGRWRVDLEGPLPEAWGRAGRVQVAFAVWNAAPAHSLGTKSISIWHELDLGR